MHMTIYTILVDSTIMSSVIVIITKHSYLHGKADLSFVGSDDLHLDLIVLAHHVVNIVHTHIFK